MKNFFTLLCVILIFGCSDMSKLVEVTGRSEKNPWTILIYMAADNDLESAALYDINELESVYEKSAGYTVLVLLDRSAGYDGTNGNWEDTRLYEIKRDNAGFNGTIVSERLNCTDLDLSVDTDTELNMADSNTLKGFITFASREYKAEHYALIIWGHGTGWRGAPARQNAVSPYRAVAFDDYGNGAYMDLPSLKQALSGFRFDVVGFDTCFGATLETSLEISHSAEFLVASSGIIPIEGWSYEDIFSYFHQGTTPEELCDIIAQSFSWRYTDETAYSISKIYLPAVSAAAELFCAFSQAVADTIVSMPARDGIFSILKTETQSEYAPVYPTDMFLDAASVVNTLNGYIQDLAGMDDETKADIQLAAERAIAAIDACVMQTMRDGRENDPAISVFFAELRSENVLAPSHSNAYVKDSGFVNQSMFVKRTTGWVPTKTGQGSLLDKVFYMSIPWEAAD
ncbi:MAG: hypothetical protein Pg6C_14100 [Treponemataceae bacterium]|nr:MAG: hypothetical protein Pg6C_14100 [Treponemataceae bacterium]